MHLLQHLRRFWRLLIAELPGLKRHEREMLWYEGTYTSRDWRACVAFLQALNGNRWEQYTSAIQDLPSHSDRLFLAEATLNALDHEEAEVVIESYLYQQLNGALSDGYPNEPTSQGAK